MNPMVLTLLFIFGMVAAVYVGVIMAIRSRSKEFKRLAGELGLEYRDSFSPAMGGGIPSLKKMALSHLEVMADLSSLEGTSLGGRRGHRLHLIMGQRQGHKAELFDFQFGQGNSKTTTTVAVFHLAAPTQVFWNLEPEGVWNKLAIALGGEDINLPRYPKFSKMFRLRSTVPALVAQHFDHRVTTVFESLPGLWAECTGDRLVLYYWGRKLSPSKARQLFQAAERLAPLLDGPTLS